MEPPNGGGILVTGEEGDGEGPSAGLLFAAGGRAADDSTRAAAVAGAMLAVLAALVSLVWALYKFKPGLIVAGVGPPTAAGPAAAVDQTHGNQEVPLLPSTTAAQNGRSASGDGTDARAELVQTTDVDLANYFSPMTTTVNRGIQTDLDSGAGWAVSSALVTDSSFEEVTKSRSEVLSSGAGGTGAMNVGTQTANLLQVDMTGQGAASNTAMYSTYSYESQAVSDTARDNSQVSKSSASSSTTTAVH